MADTNEATGNKPPWVGDMAPCVYCGQVIPRDGDRCPECRTSFSLAVRKASREVVGPWSYLDPRNPSGRGVTFETLVKMIEKGRIKADSIVRGPTTHQDWLYAAEAPRLAKYLGMCPHCFGEARPEDTYCTRCQLNMNTRPADPRPGVPADLVKAPVHRAAYQMEEQLADTIEPPERDLVTEMAAPAAVPVARAEVVRAEPPMADVPRAEPALAGVARAESVEAGRADGSRGEAARAGSLRGDAGPSSSRAAMAAAALAEVSPHSATPVDRQSRVAVAVKQKHPKIWVIEVLTIATLVPFVVLVLFLFYDLPLWISHDPRFIHAVNKVRLGGWQLDVPDAPSAQPQPSAEQVWLSQQLAAASKADQEKDYERAISIYRGIVKRTGDKAWEAHIQGFQKKIEEQRKARLVQIRERLDTAEKLSQDHQYDDALAVLRNLGKADRELLLAAGVSVDKMESSIRASQTAHAQEKQLEERLIAQLKQADSMKANPELALAAYRQIASWCPASLIQKHMDLAKTIKELDAQILAAKAATQTPTPTPTSTPAKVPTMSPEEAAKKVADIMTAVQADEKGEKFDAALAKLEAIKAQFDKKYWPPNLDAHIEQIKAKKSALDFFGVDVPKKAPPPKAP